MAADVPLRIEFEEFKRTQRATVAALASVVASFGQSQIAVANSYTDIANGVYAAFPAIFLIADIDGDPAFLLSGDSGEAVDNRNQFQDSIGGKFIRANLQ